MKQLFSLLLCAAAFPLGAWGDDGVGVTITVTNIPAVKGELRIGLYDAAKNFTDNPLPDSPIVPITSEDDITITLSNIKPGRYAVSVIQDLNGNGKLDKNFIGMPKEPLAFSVIAKIPRGKPKFDACVFEVGEEDVELIIPLVVK